jgi:hypothetical protein
MPLWLWRNFTPSLSTMVVPWLWVGVRAVHRQGVGGHLGKDLGVGHDAKAMPLMVERRANSSQASSAVAVAFCRFLSRCVEFGDLVHMS